jgi:hypothetical protein
VSKRAKGDRIIYDQKKDGVIFLAENRSVHFSSKGQEEKYE